MLYSPTQRWPIAIQGRPKILPKLRSPPRSNQPLAATATAGNDDYNGLSDRFLLTDILLVGDGLELLERYRVLPGRKRLAILTTRRNWLGHCCGAGCATG